MVTAEFMILYKYQRLERVDFFDKCLIRFTQPTEFNDPLDCCPYFKGYETKEVLDKLQGIVGSTLWQNATLNQKFQGLPLEEQILAMGIAKADRRAQYMKHPEILQDVRLNGLLGRMSQEIGILCLSERPDSMTMWAHYAEDHKSFAIGFDKDSGFLKRKEGELGDIGELKKVNYSQTRPCIIEPFDENSAEVDILFTKNIEWAYEKEWRIIRLLKDASEVKSQKYFLVSVPPEAVKEVIFGCRTDSSLIQSVMDKIRKNSKFKKVKFKRAGLSRNSYDLRLIDLFGE